MKINFKKISALATSTLMVGMTMGIAAAANYPAPFVSGGTANVAIVYGSGQGVSFLDGLEAGKIQTDLQRFLTGGTGGTGTSVEGEAISLDTSSTRIWLNTSLDVARSALTKTDLPTVLADTTFSGNAEAKVSHTLDIISGIATGADNGGTVIFARQPKSSNDPVVGISIGSGPLTTQYPIYNASAKFNRAINFTHSDSEGEEVELFGQSFTVSADTSATDLVLLKEAEKIAVDSDNPTATVEVGGATFTVELVSSSDTAATIKVTDSNGVTDTKEISEADSKKVGGLELAVITADETNLKLSATLIAGAEKMTLTNGATVTLGDDNDPIDGTTAHIVGTVGATTEIAITVYRPDSSNDAILEGTSFMDPVFGSFKIDFTGLSTPLDDAGRDMIEFGVSGDDTVTMTMTDDAENKKTFDFAHNQSGQFFLGDDTNNTIAVKERANLTEDNYIVIGNEDYGHFVQLDEVYNSSSTTPGDDRIKFRDVLSGETYTTTVTSTEGTGTLDVDGKQYSVTYQGLGSGAGSGGWATLKYPTSDSAAGGVVLFPTLKTTEGAMVALYDDTTVALDNFDGVGTDATTLNFPDGDGYTALTVAYYTNVTLGVYWNLSGASVNVTSINTSSSGSAASFTVGMLTYQIAGTAANSSVISVLNPEGGAVMTRPGVIIFEGKDDSNNYEAIFVDTEAGDGSSTDGVGLTDIFFSSPTLFEASRQTDSDLTDHVDWWGTLVTKDASESDQTTAKISYPSSQVFAQIYVGEETSAVTAGSSGTSGSTTSIGNILVMDSEVSSVSNKNLLVIGGSCINSAAATLVGGAYCGDAWMTATNVGAGEFLIKSYSGSTLTQTGKIALLVAGYNSPDTVNAATYLRTQIVDTTKHYKGTTSTSATLVETTTA